MSPELSKFRKGREAFAQDPRKAGVLNDKELRTSKAEDRKPTQDSIQRLFAEGSASGAQLDLLGKVRPIYAQEGGRSKIRYPARLTLRHEQSPMPKYLVEAEILVEGPVTDSPVPPGEFRVVGLRVLRGMEPPRPDPPPGG